MTSSSRSEGFTFLEILVALAILGASFTVLLGAHSSALRTEARARRLMVATSLARQILTDTEVEGFPALGGDEGEFEDFPDYRWERTVDNVAMGFLPVAPERLREVRIRVFWPDRGSETSLEVVYYAAAQD